MTFNNYARYYDLLYKDKDYLGETEYIKRLIEKYQILPTLNILDIGCGTGKHGNLLCKNGYQLTGIDLSEEMISIANSQKHANATYLFGNASNFNLNKQFDAICSLFHVVSYQTENSQIQDMFQLVSKHLVNDGLFIFDFWYGPAVLTDRPSIRIKRLEDDNIKVTRIAEPVIYPNRNVVDVNYELLIQVKHSGRLDIINETHSMRYYYQTELNYLLESNGLKAICFEEWMTGKEPSFETWGVCCIAKKD